MRLWGASWMQVGAAVAVTTFSFYGAYRFSGADFTPVDPGPMREFKAPEPSAQYQKKVA